MLIEGSGQDWMKARLIGWTAIFKIFSKMHALRTPTCTIPGHCNHRNKQLSSLMFSWRISILLDVKLANIVNPLNTDQYCYNVLVYSGDLLVTPNGGNLPN